MKIVQTSFMRFGLFSLSSDSLQMKSRPVRILKMVGAGAYTGVLRVAQF